MKQRAEDGVNEIRSQVLELGQGIENLKLALKDLDQAKMSLYEKQKCVSKFLPSCEPLNHWLSGFICIFQPQYNGIIKKKNSKIYFTSESNLS